MSTPAVVRQCIVDHATAAITAQPALLGEIYRVRTPQQTELLLTQLQIDMDAQVSAPIKAYIIDCGGEYLITPLPGSSNTLLLDNLQLAYFSPSVRSVAKGLIRDSDLYNAYLKQQEDMYDKVRLLVT